MATCEKCGASFAPSAAPAEVSTTRVLCPACAAARAAEKARAKITPTVARSAPAAPKTVSTPVAAAAKVPAVVPPARQVPSAPPPPPPRAAAPTKRADAPPPPKPPAAKSAPAARKPVHAGHVSELDKEELARKKNRAVVIGYVVSFVLMIVAGVVVWQVLGKHRHDKQVIADHQKAVDDFFKRFQEMDINTEENALAAAKYAEDNRKLWEDDDAIGSDVLSRAAKAASNAKLFHERTDLTNEVTKIEAQFAAPSNLTPDAVIDARRRLDDIEPQVGTSGELLARVAALRASVDRLYADRLLEDARASATAGPTRDTLQKFLRADDEIRNLLDAAKKAKNTALDEHFEALYKTVVKESDEAVAKVFTPEEIEKAPWRDLLADKELANWLAPAAKGFEWRLENDTLHIIGPDADAEGLPILSIGDKEKWCDFVGEMEFTLVKGEANLYFRLGLGGSATRAAIAPQVLTTQGDANALVAGAPNKLTFSIVGSSYLFEIAGYGMDAKPPSWNRVRKGALAFEFDPKTKTELRITKLRVKVLRAGG